ncbi:MAG: DUF362 domain-containing protein, partial [Thermodesulfobacteriota bacterium]|nr:DUF362 domain-containing protein [Thermodesulfobacteriota bacterium]
AKIASALPAPPASRYPCQPPRATVAVRKAMIANAISINIADLCTFFRPNLIVLDATRILIANGPSGGDLKDVKIMNTIIVGTDQVAVDAYGATLFEKSARDIDYIANGARMELGRIDIEKLFIQEIEV